MTRLYEGTSASDTFDGRCVGHRLKVNFPPSWQKEFQIYPLKMKTHLEISNCKRNQDNVLSADYQLQLPFIPFVVNSYCAKPSLINASRTTLLGHVIRSFSFHFEDSLAYDSSGLHKL